MAYKCELVCDVCGDTCLSYLNQTVSKTRIERIARDGGWKKHESIWVCPICQRKNNYLGGKQMSYRYTIETENPIVTDGNKMFNCKDGKLRLKIVDANPWHTGTPTEEGWYLIKYKHNGGIRYIAMENPSKWVFINDDTLRWQKIEETSR